MQIFVLLGCTNYEGDTVLGVYDSLENAENARNVYLEEKNGRYYSGFDDYEIVIRDLNAAAEEKF